MKKGNIIIIILIILGIVSILGLSYAYFVSNITIENKDNSNTNISTGSAVEVILETPKKVDNTKVIPGIKTSKEYIVKGKGDSNSIPTNASLVISPALGDFSNYVYWQVYKSDEEITCTRKLDTTSLEIKYISECNIPDSAQLVLSGNTDTLHINMSIEYNTYNKYYLVTEYIDNNKDQSELMDKTFSIDVSITKELDTIEDKIIAELDASGKCPTVNDDGSVNVTAAESENSLLCSAPDAYGTSYYYRGNVSNNYVKFAGFYWRIVRINGDGSIRLIYDGTIIHKNGESSTDRIIGTSAYNASYDDNAYVGYMYGTPGSSSYKDTHKNINDSTIKKYIDTWYENNLKNTDYEKYLADNIFCNDRTVSKTVLTNYTNLGYKGENTTYRWYFDPTMANLSCLSKNDAFTVEENKSGNSSLKYFIGLLSNDEFYLAGGYVKWAVNYKNTFYLYTGSSYWLMSAAGYGSNSAWVTRIDTDGNKNGDHLIVDTAYGVKPVINLKAGSLKSGLGTMESPYTVE